MNVAPIQRAAYFLKWAYGNGASPGDGVKKKIGEQLRRWRALGIKIRIFISARRECRAAWLTEVEPDELFVSVAATRLARFASFKEIHRAVETFAPDFLYIRQEVYSPQLGRLMERWPSFAELNGDELAEVQLTGVRDACYWMYRAISRSAFFRRVIGLVAVSRELASARAFTRYDLPTVVIANGIDLSLFEPLPPPKANGLRFGFIGASLGARWHGASKIVDLARLRPDWQFDIIGLKASEFDGPIPQNLTAHGVLDRAHYEPVLAECDVAFGSLSGYEKKAWEGSALKVRQYLAFGIPIVSGVRDTDFPDGADFLLLLPNTSDNVLGNVERIEAFARRWKGRRVPRDQITHIDFGVKEARRIDFVTRVLSGRPPSN